MNGQTLTRIFRQKKDARLPLFVPYLMAGDGGLGALRERITFLAEAGADAVEVGIPFTDPAADGEAIQRAGERALAEGTTLRRVLETLAGQAHSIPIIIMTYLNPIVAMGVPSFILACTRAGVSGLIIPDLPFEERALVTDELKGSGIAFIPLVSLTSSTARIAKITEGAEGFIYAVTVNGITGSRTGFSSQLDDHLRKLRETAGVPVLAGFGISTAAQIERFQAAADGVIVGSAIVEAFHHGDLETIRSLAQAGRAAVRP